MTKTDAQAIIKKPSNQDGTGSDFRCRDSPAGGWYILAVSYSSEKEVRLRWKKKLLKALWTLFWAILAVMLLTTKAC